MIVAESGEEQVGRWLDEERNVYEDYKKAFREEPLLVNGVAIMTDTDNTGERAIAYCGDIAFKNAELFAVADADAGKRLCFSVALWNGAAR